MAGLIINRFAYQPRVSHSPRLPFLPPSADSFSLAHSVFSLRGVAPPSRSPVFFPPDSEDSIPWILFPRVSPSSVSSVVLFCDPQVRDGLGKLPSCLRRYRETSRKVGKFDVLKRPLGRDSTRTAWGASEASSWTSNHRPFA